MSKRSERPSSPPRAVGGASGLRKLPSVEKLLSRPAFERLSERYGRAELVATTRDVLASLRARALAGGVPEPIDDALANLDGEVARRLERSLEPSLRRAVNATGILVHTNLGRAPLSAKAIEALVEIAKGYSNLELDLESGKRGSRNRHAARLFDRLFPGKKTLVVNNAAAAVMLSLNTFADGKEVVISRGELVEIGGSFRVPEILSRSGARLREVGTTNKTRIEDYRRAIGPETGAILRVHPSNFRIVGFTESATAEELVALALEKELPVIEDLGSGNLLSLAPHGLPEEPTVPGSLASGVHVCIFSGDKLLGGPQAGILVGEPSRVEACARNPMARALRVDKLVYAALEATLSSYLSERALEDIPILRMLSSPPEEIRRRARALVERLSRVEKLSLDVEPGTSRVGGGAAPDAELPTWVIAATVSGASAESIAAALRMQDPPVVARISEDRVLLDLRTVAPEEESILERALERIG